MMYLPLGSMLGWEVDQVGRTLVEDDLSLATHPEVFVAGDLAAVEGVPGVAPAAMQMGRHVATIIAGGVRSPFRYRDRGSLATIGRARGVADFGMIRFDGFFAWLAWLVIHIFYLIGFRNRFFVLAGWAFSSNSASTLSTAFICSLRRVAARADRSARRSHPGASRSGPAWPVPRMTGIALAAAP